MTSTKKSILAKRYLLPGEDENAMYMRVAKHIASVEEASKRNLWTDKFYDIMQKHYFLPNTPCLVNAGRGNNLSACFTLDIQDNMDSIFETLHQSAILFKGGGGVGYNFSNLRREGDKVQSTNGVSSGPISFMSMFDKMTEVVKQGGCRRGAMMGILRVDHPDIEKFINCKEDGTKLNNFNISIAVTDKFMAAVDTDEDYDLIDPVDGSVYDSISARYIFDKISQAAWRNGEPGIIFIDEINRHNPTPDYGDIVSTNPCVTADTHVFTKRGCERVRDLLDISADYIDVCADNRFTGKEDEFYLATKPFLTADVDDIYRIRTKRGYEIRCNSTHKFHKLTKYGHVDVETRDLAVGDVLPLYDGECVFDDDSTIMLNGLRFNTESQILAARLMACLFVLRRDIFFEEYNDKDGVVKGITLQLSELKQEINKLSKMGKEKRMDGQGGKERTYRLKRRLYETYKIAIESAVGFIELMKENNKGAAVLEDTRLKKKSTNLEWYSNFKSTLLYQYLDTYFGFNEDTIYDIPNVVMAGSRQAFIEYMRVFSYFNTIFNKEHILFTSPYRLQLADIQRRLQSFGIVSTLGNYKRTDSVDVHRNNKNVRTISCDMWNLKLENGHLYNYVHDIGFMDFFQLKAMESYTDQDEFDDDYEDTIVSIEKDGIEPVYCLTQPIGNTVVFNGIATKNCGESPLLPGESCCLGSVNIYEILKAAPDYQDFFVLLGETVTKAVRFLDNLIDCNHYPLPIIEENTKRTRKIGLGVMGLADHFILRRIRYGSPLSITIANGIMEFISNTANAESLRLGKSKGTPGKIISRNATRTSIAPTGSISIIAECSSGIEPVFCHVYKRHIDDKDFYEIDPAFKVYVDELEISKDHKDEVYEYVAKHGTVKGCVHIPDMDQNYLVNASEVSPIEHVVMMATFQKHTNLAVSKTVNLPSTATVGDIVNIYKKAYYYKCKGITVYRDGSRDNQVLTAAVVKQLEKPMPVTVYENNWSNHSIPVEDRPMLLQGTTKKVRTTDGCFYLTVNGLHGKPVEIFATPNTNAKESAVNAEALSRVCSLALRFGVPVNELIEQMTKVRYQSMLSLPHNIATALHEFSENSEFPVGEEACNPPRVGVKVTAMEPGATVTYNTTCPGAYPADSLILDVKGSLTFSNQCPECKHALIREEGCMKCHVCGYSKCGG